MSSPAPAPASSPIDEPARSDRLVTGLSEAIGGPLGEHAVRPPNRSSSSSRSRRFWSASRIIMALVCLTLALHWVQKSPCRTGSWNENFDQYRHLCYTDVLALYYAEGLADGKVPYAQHPVEYPVLTGALMGVLGLPLHAYAKDRAWINQGQAFYDINAVVLSIFGVGIVAAILALRRRRPWDAALFALAPALVVTATINWDLFAAGLTAFAMWAWAKRRPVWAGVLLGLAIAAKFYPLLLIGPLVVLALRSGRLQAALITLGTTVATWLAINLPVALLWRDSWSTFFRFNSERGIDWGTLWYVLQGFPLGPHTYGISWFKHLNDDPAHAKLNALYLSLFAISCLGIALVALLAPRRPRFAQLAFLVVAAFLIFGKVWSQQYVLWLLPLAVMARPRWGAFLAWQAAEICYFLAFYGELLGASGKGIFEEWVFILAASLRVGTVAMMCGFVIRDILRPELDAVRRTYPDDPDGGDFDEAPDHPIFTGLRDWVFQGEKTKEDTSAAPPPPPAPELAPAVPAG